MRLRIDFDLFSLLIIAFFTVLIVTHKKKAPVKVTTQAITMTQPEDLGTIELPSSDPMNDDNPNGKSIRALEKLERAESDRVLARAYGIPVEKLHWTPVSPGYNVGRAKRIGKR